MRKIIAIIITLILAVALFSSCGRYENGPAFSMRSAKARLVGEWTLSDLLVNDKHEQALFDKEASSELILNNDGTYTYKIKAVRANTEMSGLWSFGEDKTELLFTEVDTINGNIEHSYRITRLTNEEVWLISGGEEYTGIDDLIERHFEKQKN